MAIGKINFLDALIIKATASSTTEVKFADGEFVTFIFLDFAYSISMLSTPTPHLAIIFSLSPFSIISFVSWVELLITTTSASIISETKSLSFDSDAEMSIHSPSDCSSSKLVYSMYRQ